MRSLRRRKVITLKEYEAKKLKLERRLDNLKRDYVQVLQAIQQISQDLAKSLEVSNAVRE